ncbi:hypothetical protein [Streptomyces sp. G1]|uniref:hypothetical protein n=1 Tax=Streptomyces sp. G1 TaxID=361572 RepID=UPI002030F32C|nr:hypothetical protein [Streptomyces sp. G1]MCM1973085.1 hypothetical protein [Streptomyces sp. G1]
MSINAHLRDSVRLPGGRALVNGFALDSRGGMTPRAILRNGHELEAYDLYEVFAGDSAPLAVFPLPWPGWEHGVHSVSPDSRFAVFSGQRAVRAVGVGGETLWEYRHGCWGPEIGHPHSVDEQQVCRGFESGSCRISDDGRQVWAHVVLEPEAGQWQECWVVLDARDGRELARLPLESAASGSHQLSHPDGTHMGLCIGMGQDGILIHWGRWDGVRLTSWDHEESTDRILSDVHPKHPGFLTVEHYGADLRLHALDGTVLAEREPDTGEDDEDTPCWDHLCGFVDADTVIASTLDSDEDTDRARHWLLDARTLEIRGCVTYPGGRVDSYVTALGDGTWLTYDDRTETLHRWAVRD